MGGWEISADHHCLHLWVNRECEKFANSRQVDNVGDFNGHRNRYGFKENKQFKFDAKIFDGIFLMAL